MSAIGNRLTRIEDGWVHFNFEMEPTTNLKKYCDIQCAKKCDLNITEAEILARHESIFEEELCNECDCEIALLYNAMWKLAEYEAIGLSPHEIVDLKIK